MFVRRRLRKHVGSELSECKRTHTHTRLEYTLGKPLEATVSLYRNGTIAHWDSVDYGDQGARDGRPGRFSMIL